MMLYSAIAESMDKDIPDPTEFFKMLKLLDPEAEPVEPEEIWELVKDHKDLTAHLGNTHLHILFTQITGHLDNLGITEVETDINALCSSLYIGGDAMHCVDDLQAVLLEFKGGSK